MKDRYGIKPGPETDALVAEKVLGWSYQTFLDGFLPDVKHWYSVSPCPNNPGHPSFRGVLKHWSTSIADAWEVVEKMWPSGSSMCITPAGLGWSIYIPTRVVMHWREPYARAETAPMAICLAALKAVGAIE